VVLDSDSYSEYPLDELLADLKKLEGFIDGVVVSGGEPTIDTGLPAFLTLFEQFYLLGWLGRIIGRSSSGAGDLSKDVID
jgi:hypothetical protein